MSYGSIYKITNQVNGKVYVGQTIKPIETRLKQHIASLRYKKPGCAKLQRALRKHGPENFVISLLGTANSLEELNVLEQSWIAKLDSMNNGYNLDSGGKVCKRSQETIEKIAEASRNRITTQETRKKMSDSRMGIVYSEETIKRMSIASKLRNIDHLKKHYKETSIAVLQYTKDFKFVAEYESLAIAYKNTGILVASISTSCRYVNFSAGEFVWIYKENAEINLEKKKTYKHPQKVLVDKYTLGGTFVARYESASDAARSVGSKHGGHVSGCCLGNRKKHKNFIFKYAEE
jgi:group I intron endonuclease